MSFCVLLVFNFMVSIIMYYLKSAGVAPHNALIYSLELFSVQHPYHSRNKTSKQPPSPQYTITPLHQEYKTDASGFENLLKNWLKIRPDSHKTTETQTNLYWADSASHCKPTQTYSKTYTTQPDPTRLMLKSENLHPCHTPYKWANICKKLVSKWFEKNNFLTFARTPTPILQVNIYIYKYINT